MRTADRDTQWGMIGTLGRIVTAPEMRTKLLLTLGILVLYRFGAFLPVPGLTPEAIASGAAQLSQSSILQLLAVFGGGALGTISLFTLGVGPYITASILMQFAARLIPHYREIAKEPGGQDKINQITRYLTLAVSVLQAVAIVLYFHSRDLLPGVSFWGAALVTFSLIAGSMLLMWLGEIITKRGVGNGISLLIFASIVSSLPTTVQAWLGFDPVQQVLILALFLGVIVGVVYVNEAQRRIPIQYARQATGRMERSGRTFLPIPVLMAGVMPAIFAFSFLFIPQIIVEVTGYGTGVAAWISPGSWGAIILEALLIIAFTYFYTGIIFDPIEQSENLRNQGGFVPGVRPGNPTAVFLNRIVTRLTLPGALFLAFLALIPSVLFRYLPATGGLLLGGTSMLIVVGVALLTVKQMESQLLVHSYERMVLGNDKGGSGGLLSRMRRPEAAGVIGQTPEPTVAPMGDDEVEAPPSRRHERPRAERASDSDPGT